MLNVCADIKYNLMRATVAYAENAPLIDCVTFSPCRSEPLLPLNAANFAPSAATPPASGRGIVF